MNIAVLASGNGTNFQALVQALSGNSQARIKLLITDKKSAPARGRAKRLRIPEVFINPLDFKSSLEYDKELVRVLRRQKIGLVVLAGYMRIVSPYFVRSFKNKILNIHPAILPAFRGKEAIRRAFDYGCKLSGVTVHFVDEKVDHGPIILQESLKIKPQDTLRSLEIKIHRLEHRLFPQAVKLVSAGKIKIKGRKTKII